MRARRGRIAVADFPSTHWTLLRTGEADPGRRRDAWEQLARRYRAPIRAYFASRLGAGEADDQAQEFLLRSVRDDWWQRADPGRGRFRGFLRVLLDRYVMNARRGARVAVDGEDELAEQPSRDAGPELAYDRAFAATLAERALARIAAEYARRGQAAQFALLQPFMVEAAPGELRATAGATGATPNALAASLLRLRRAHAQAMRDELASLLDDPAELDAEWSELAAALSASSSVPNG